MGDESEYMLRLLYEMHAADAGEEEAGDFSTRLALALDLARAGEAHSFRTAFAGSKWEEDFVNM